MPSIRQYRPQHVEQIPNDLVLPKAGPLLRQILTATDLALQQMQRDLTAAGVLTAGTSSTALTNTLLDGVNHTDTLLGVVAAGDIIVGNTTPKWSRLATGTGSSSATDGFPLGGQLLRAAGAGVAPSWGNPVFIDHLGTPAEEFRIGSGFGNNTYQIRFDLDNILGIATVKFPRLSALTYHLAFVDYANDGSASYAPAWTALQTFRQNAWEISGISNTSRLLHFDVDSAAGSPFTMTVRAWATAARTVEFPDATTTILGYGSGGVGGSQPSAGTMFYGTDTTHGLSSLAIGASGSAFTTNGAAPAWTMNPTYLGAWTITPTAGTALTLTPPSGTAKALDMTVTDAAYVAGNLINVNVTYSGSSIVSPVLLNMITAIDNMTGGTLKGITMSVRGSSDSGTPSITGLDFTGSAGNIGNFNTVQAISATPRQQSSGTISILRGIQVQPASNGSGLGVVSTLEGVNVQIITNACTITDTYALRVRNPAGGTATYTTVYGLHLANLTKGGTNWAIYSLGGQSSHLGKFAFGTNTAPTAMLDVTQVGVGTGIVLATSVASTTANWYEATSSAATSLWAIRPGTTAANPTGHWFSGQATKPTIAANANLGTGPTVTVVAGSTDTAGKVTLLSGTAVGLAAGAQATITFYSPYNAAPKCVLIIPTTAAAAAIQPYVTTVAAGTFDISFAVLPVLTTQYDFYYLVIE